VVHIKPLTACVCIWHSMLMQPHEDRKVDLNDARNWDTPLFPMMTVATCGNLRPNTLRSWFQRGFFKLQSSDAAAGMNGLPHLFSLRSALAIGAASELIALGEHPQTAFQAALAWTYKSRPLIEGRDRDPAGLYGDEYYAVLVSSMGPQPARVFPVPRAQPSGLPFFTVFADGQRSARMVWLDQVDAYVRKICDVYLHPVVP
jgi:hypothetical protein